MAKLLYSNMVQILFPAGNPVLKGKIYSRETLDVALTDIFKNRPNFIGHVRADKADGTQFYLFFLKGAPYAAGMVSDMKPHDMSVSEFFVRLNSAGQEKMTLSVWETDPVALKCMLVFLQQGPTVKAATAMLNLQDILEDIRSQKAEAMIFLRKGEQMNFFYFKDGKGAISHFSDIDFKEKHAGSVDEQVQLYAYLQEENPVEAYIYRDLTTSSGCDPSGCSVTEIKDMLYGRAKPSAHISKPGGAVRFSVTEGQMLGQTIECTPPTIFGRKEADIVIEDPRVSRKHASLKVDGGKLLLTDLGSTNGTFVNGQRISSKHIAPGDIVTIGKTGLKLEA